MIKEKLHDRGGLRAWGINRSEGSRMRSGGSMRKFWDPRARIGGLEARGGLKFRGGGGGLKSRGGGLKSRGGGLQSRGGRFPFSSTHPQPFPVFQHLFPKLSRITAPILNPFPLSSIHPLPIVPPNFRPLPIPLPSTGPKHLPLLSFPLSRLEHLTLLPLPHHFLSL